MTTPALTGLPGDVEGIDLLPAVVVDGGIDSEEERTPNASVGQRYARARSSPLRVSPV